MHVVVENVLTCATEIAAAAATQRRACQNQHQHRWQ
jgi:hypothetical protein